MSDPPRMLIHLASGQLHDVPSDDEWLSADERAVLAALKLEKRRGEWRLGRWLARRAVHAALCAEQAALRTDQALRAEHAAARNEHAMPRTEDTAFSAELPGISIIAAGDGAPEVHGLASPLALTISHRQGRGVAAAACDAAPIGCDLEFIEPRSERFIRDWLTPGESARILSAPAPDRPLLANLCWSAKEAASKVLRVGLRFDTRSFAVELPDQYAVGGTGAGTWLPIGVTAAKSGEHFVGVWRACDGFVHTVLAGTPFDIREEDSSPAKK